MEKYYCKTSTGTTVPKYIHHDLKLAVDEAKRLSTQFNCNVEILKVVGTVKWVDVPVTRKEQVVEVKSNDLPF